MKWWRRLLRGGQEPGRVKWGRDFPDWDSARRASSGYDGDLILERVVQATRAVEEGRAAYERDSVLFDEVEYSWPLLASLLWVHGRRRRLKVVDFGGSLGSTWRQNRRFLEKLPDVSWNVVEQTSFVEAGRGEFETPPLRFHESVEAASFGGTDVFLLASSLCYLPNYREILDLAWDSKADFLVLDRTPFHKGPHHRIQVQEVPPEIYPASYPCYIFSESRFQEEISPRWNPIERWVCQLQPDPAAIHQGMILERASR